MSRDRVLRDALDAATKAVIEQDKRLNPSGRHDRRSHADITECAVRAAYIVIRRQLSTQPERDLKDKLLGEESISAAFVALKGCEPIYEQDAEAALEAALAKATGAASTSDLASECDGSEHRVGVAYHRPTEGWKPRCTCGWRGSVGCDFEAVAKGATKHLLTQPDPDCTSHLPVGETEAVGGLDNREWTLFERRADGSLEVQGPGLEEESVSVMLVSTCEDALAKNGDRVERMEKALMVAAALTGARASGQAVSPAIAREVNAQILASLDSSQPPTESSSSGGSK